MQQYNVTAETRYPAKGSGLADRVGAWTVALEDYSAAVIGSDYGRLALILTIPAATMSQAFSTAHALVKDATKSVPLAVEVMLTDEWDRRVEVDGDQSRAKVPKLLTVEEASVRLDVSRTRAQQLIDSGHLPAVKVGSRYAVPEPWLDAFKEKDRPTGVHVTPRMKQGLKPKGKLR